MSQTQQDEGWTEKDQQQEPLPKGEGMITAPTIAAAQPPVGVEHTSFITRELERVVAALVVERNGSPRWHELYLVQQSLKWTLDPTGYASPLTLLPENTSDTEAERAQKFVATLATALRMAKREGGANATMHVGDVLRLIEAFQAGDIGDTEVPITGPFYPRDRQ